MARNAPHKPLQQRLDDMERRLGVLEQLARQDQALRPDTHTEPTPGRVTPTPSVPAPRLAPPMTPVPQAAPRERQPIDVERWLKWAGVALVVLAASFLLNVAIQRGWLTPAVRVAGGLVIGLALYVAGMLARPRSDQYATALQAGGATVSYLMLWAGFQVFDLIPFALTGVGMLVVVAALFIDVFRFQDSTLGVLATLGGFATPFFLAETGAGTPTDAAPLLAYIAFFVVLTATVHFLVGWRTLQIVAAGAAVVSLGLASGTNNPSPHPDALGHTLVMALIAVAYWLVPTLARTRTEGARTDHLPVSDIARSLDDALGNLVRLSGFALLGITFTVVAVLWDLTEAWSGALSFGLALVAAGVAYAVRASQVDSVISGLLSSVFVTVGLALLAGFARREPEAARALLLDGETRMIALAAQATALIVISPRLDFSVALRVQAHALSAISFIMLLVELLDGYWTGGAALPLSALVVIGLFAGAGWQQQKEPRAAYLLAGFSGLLALILHLLGGSDVGQAFVTGIWAVIGLGLILFGRFQHLRALELTGLGTLGLVLIRLLGHLGDIDPLIRVFLFLAVGVLFLGGGWYFRAGRKPARRDTPTTHHSDPTP